MEKLKMGDHLLAIEFLSTCQTKHSIFTNERRPNMAGPNNCRETRSMK